MKWICSRCRTQFEGPTCPRCGQAAAGYTQTALPPAEVPPAEVPPARPRAWVGIVLAAVFVALLAVSGLLARLVTLF